MGFAEYGSLGKLAGRALNKHLNVDLVKILLFFALSVVELE